MPTLTQLDAMRSLPVPGYYSGAPVSRNVLVSCAHTWISGDNPVVSIDNTYLKVLKRMHVTWDRGKGKPLAPDLMAYLIEPIPDYLPIPIVRPPKDIRACACLGVNHNGERFPLDFTLDNVGTLLGTIKRRFKPTTWAPTAWWLPIPRKGGRFFTMRDSGSRVLGDDGSGDLIYLATLTDANNGPYLPYWLEGIRQTAERLGGEVPPSFPQPQ
jgi:hypothetical protein